MKYIAFTFFFVALLLCSCNNNKVNDTQSTDLQTEDTLRTITEEMAYEGVNNYCHKEYDWSVAKDNPDIMFVLSWTEKDDFLAGTDFQRQSELLEEPFQAIYISKLYHTKIIWSLHPNRFSFERTNTEEMCNKNTNGPEV